MTLVRKFLPIGLVWLSTRLAVAAANLAAQPLLTKAVADGDSLSFSAGGNQVEVQVCLPNLVKVSVLKNGQKVTDTPSIWKKSWSEVRVAFDLQSDPLVVSTDKMVIKVSRASGRVSFYDSSGNLLIKEHDD